MRDNTRFYHIDLLKFIAILFVCIYHFWYGLDIYLFEHLGFRTCIQRFFFGLLSICVPLFFVTNGALLLNKSFHAKKHYRKLCIIILQFFIWRLITLFSLGIIKNVDFSTLPGTDLFNLIFLFYWTDLVPISHFWFIPMLIGIQLMYPFIKQQFDLESSDTNSRSVLIVSMCILFVLSFVLHDINVFKHLSTNTSSVNTDWVTIYFDPFATRVGTMVLYFILGGYLQKYRDKLCKIPTVICILGILLGMLVSFSVWNFRSHQLWYSYDNVFEGYGSIPTLVCTILTFALALKLNPLIAKSHRTASVISLIGSNTLSVYYIHWILGHILKEYVYDASQTALQLGILGNLCIGMFLVFTCTFVGLLIKKIPLIGKYIL